MFVYRNISFPPLIYFKQGRLSSATFANHRVGFSGHVCVYLVWLFYEVAVDTVVNNGIESISLRYVWARELY